jgi:hypothetical protein
LTSKDHAISNISLQRLKVARLVSIARGKAENEGGLCVRLALRIFTP